MVVVLILIFVATILGLGSYIVKLKKKSSELSGHVMCRIIYMMKIMKSLYGVRLYVVHTESTETLGK